ncbi:GNAT family N-acetyltransferase [Kineococcus arenarius]|uniref:GNAT family N-acetyltransferase n=1 Tax=unclassified Kineococcus TaxID=2621656 RepID=UPI003D7C62A8
MPEQHPTEVPRSPSWLPSWFRHPTRLDLATGHHLRPIREVDVDLDLPAVLASRERLWSIYGEAWGWPPEGMTREQDRADLARHEAETARHESFDYALFDDEEAELLGCVYLEPPGRAGADADVSWWVVDRLVGSELEAVLDAEVPRWVHRDWPFTAPRFVGRDLTWQQWLALPPPPSP